MEAIGPLLDFLKERPDLFVTAFITFNWWLERNERRVQQKVNFDLQQQLLTQADATKQSLIEIKTILQVLTQGRHS